MSWNDGSRFLIASGVKWGTGPKMYKGSSTDTTWNNDLLWKLYVEQEARKTGIPLPKDSMDVEAAPPIMKPLAAAVAKGYKSIPFHDPFEHDPAKTCQMHSDRSSPLRRLNYLKAFPDEAAKLGPPRRREKSRDAVMLETGRRSLDKSASSPHLPPRSARSSTSVARASARSATSRRLANLEKMLTQERAARQDLSASLMAEMQRRKKVETDLKAFQDRMSSSIKSQAGLEGKLEKYKEIVENLATTMKKADARRSARGGGSARRSSRR